MVKASCTPVSGQGGSLWTLTQKSTFPNEFGGEMQATDKVIQKNQNSAKNRIYNYKTAAKKPISISRHKISDQKWENHFPEGIFPCKISDQKWENHFPEGIFPWNLAHNWRL